MADTLTGSIERITYYNPENGYCVLRLRPDKRQRQGTSRDGLVTVVGRFPELGEGEALELKGSWIKHPKHGLQYEPQSFTRKKPASLEGIRRYLSSGMIKGIGARLAERIVDHFGSETLEVIEKNPERLQEVADIGPKRAGTIAAAWEEQKHIQDIMLFLHSQKISTNLALKIYKQYGNDALQVVRNDPYCLARDIYGVGFKTADQVARNMGLSSEHPSRIEAGILYTLDQFSNDGSVFCPLEILVKNASDLLNVRSELISPGVERIETQDQIKQEFIPPIRPMDRGEDVIVETTFSDGTGIADPIPGIQAVYLTPLYYSEIGVARRLAELAAVIPSLLSDIPPLFINIGPDLSQEQRRAIERALSNPVSVLTGGPGTGKTTAIRALIQVLESSNKKYALASPTGRAAKRLSEATGKPASTIHRLLSYTPVEGFRHHEGNPLNIDLLVVDEASMLDLVLAYHLLKAIKPGTHILFVGDFDQLPSVGPGDFLRDAIRSKIAIVTCLSVIFRQAADSFIITNAHRINQGKMPVFSPRKDQEKGKGSDFYLFACETPEDAADWVIEIVNKRIPDKFGLNSREDIQVLTPMYRGPAGVDALNEKLQETLNPVSPRKAEKRLHGQIYRVGDKLMQIRNNYDKDIFNGDIGFLKEIDLSDHSLIVNFDGRDLGYDWSEADQLVQAYAISVHKSQGSEFAAVVIPLVTQHYIMLQRNLLYTAITRAKQLCVLVGSQRAIGIAVRNNKVAQRYSGLEYRLRQEYQSSLRRASPAHGKANNG